MSLSKYATPLRLDLKPSRKLLVFILSCHALAAASLFMLPLWWAVTCTAGITLSLIYTLKQQGFIVNGKNICTLVRGTDGLWIIIRRDGTEAVAQLAPDTYVSTFMVIVSLKENITRTGHRVVILPDSVRSDTFRQLRVRLNTHT